MDQAPGRDQPDQCIENDEKEHRYYAIPSSPVEDRRASKVCVCRMVAHFVTSLVEVLSINQCREGECESLKQKLLAKVPFFLKF